jgi:peptidoglycan/xylan/chitin deacetylase (PgdA/CDA1 family)
VDAISNAIKHSGVPVPVQDINLFLQYTLGEERFGDTHWKISDVNRLYWLVKPLLPRPVIRGVRSIASKYRRDRNNRHWPIDDRYTKFLWGTIWELLRLTGKTSFTIKDFWPHEKNMAFVLTHDVESERGQSYIPLVADLEESFGFRSSFNIVGNQIPTDRRMIQEMTQRGFEIGIHGWRHDATPFENMENFQQSAQMINTRLQELDLVGHRFPLNMRNPVWMQSLNIEYDLSFFDSDPFEPIPGGAMTIWPFMIGHFLELPATLTQDNTLINLLGEKTPRIWLEKVNFLHKYHGMALLNSHPDYLIHKEVWSVYRDFLAEMSTRTDVWNEIPRNVTTWWKSRAGITPNGHYSSYPRLTVKLEDSQIEIVRQN